MFKLNLKIAWRNLWKNKVYTSINIGGLAIALTTFMMVFLYVSYEDSYDQDLPEYEHIYLVGRNLPDAKTGYTPAPMAELLRENFPEVAAVGRTRYTGFEFPINTDHGRVYANQAIQMEFEVAKMFKIWPSMGLSETKGMGLELYVPRHFYAQLFPNQAFDFPKKIALGPKKDGQGAEVRGIIDRNDAHSNIKFDVLAMGKDISFGNKDYESNPFETYIRVKSGTDINLLQEKIGRLYKKELEKSGVIARDSRLANRELIYLDPLKNLHLKPQSGTDNSEKTVKALFLLSLLILVIACINFTNLSVAQSTKRAKEVGVKKVMGAYRFDLILQFIAEILMQCFLALILGLLLTELLLPAFNTLYGIRLSLWSSDMRPLIWQLPLILLVITLISGVYPAVVLSGYKPAAVLKGDLQTSYRTVWLRNLLLTGQFSIAIVFIVSLLIVKAQLKYMQTAEVGFRPQQVVHIKNIQFYDNPADFEPVHQKIMKIPGVKAVTVASSIPDGSRPGTAKYRMNGKASTIDFVDVDFDYFETLQIDLKDGRLFDRAFKTDSLSGAILNETAAARFGLIDPVGKVIRGCDLDYRVVGLIKDYKAQGFENPVQPTIYTIKNPCNHWKIKLMLSIDQNKMATVLASLRSQWPDINKLDGEDFRYEFLDEVYGRLFQKQEQLQSVFFFAATLTILIALIGLFAFSAFTTSNRIKEISIRKILGATDFQLLKLLNVFFIWMVLLANLIAWPFAYLVATKWLDLFAYRIEISPIPFLTATLLSIGLTIITVSLQTRKAVRMNPVNALKYE